MSLDSIPKSIFITNTLAGAYPDKHIEYWKKFEAEVPKNKRTGAYGADNIAYVKFLKEQNDPFIVQFLNEYIVRDSF